MRKDTELGIVVSRDTTTAILLTRLLSACKNKVHIKRLERYYKNSHCINVSLSLSLSLSKTKHTLLNAGREGANHPSPLPRLHQQCKYPNCVKEHRTRINPRCQSRWILRLRYHLNPALSSPQSRSLIVSRIFINAAGSGCLWGPAIWRISPSTRCRRGSRCSSVGTTITAIALRWSRVARSGCCIV
jgi:hypothetical protein